MKWLSDNTIEHLRSISDVPDFSTTKYRVVKEIARGGMGTVYLAQDVELGREVAVKVLNLPELNSDLARRMVREAQIIAGLEHPGIVPVHDVGTLRDGRVFYAMKFVRGNRLDEYANQSAGLKERLRKFQSVCDAVAFAHAHGVVHRDLKPQNIMIGSFGEVLVLDWGVAKLLSKVREVASEADTLMLVTKPEAPAENSIDTLQGTIIGTPPYMSPEQSDGEVQHVDERSDIYSLGAILYFLLSDQPPAQKSTARSPGNAASRSIPSPRQVNSKVSKRAEAICLKAMAQSPADRYATAAEMSLDIDRLLDAESVSAYRENVFERLARWFGKNRFLVLLVLAYLLMRIFLLLTAKR